MGDGLHGMEQKAAGYKPQHQNIQVLTDKELGTLSWSSAISRAKIGGVKGKVGSLRLLRASKLQIHRLRKALWRLLQSGTV